MSTKATELLGLTVRQPWAWAIAELEKDVENRVWQTKHRGPIAIHSSSVFRRRDYEFARRWIWEHLQEEVPQPADLVLGAIVCVVDLIAVQRTDDTRLLKPWEMPGGYGWLLDNHRKLQRPVYCPGRQRLWRVPQNLVPQLAA